MSRKKRTSESTTPCAGYLYRNLDLSYKDEVTYFSNKLLEKCMARRYRDDKSKTPCEKCHHKDINWLNKEYCKKQEDCSIFDRTTTKPCKDWQGKESDNG